jgi:hypothetical protein
MEFRSTRIVRTPHSERFVLSRPEGGDFAALELHYLPEGTVAGTLILFEEAKIPDDRVPEILKRIDEELLPEVSIEERSLSFTVVVGRVLGSFVPQTDKESGSNRISGSED